MAGSSSASPLGSFDALLEQCRTLYHDQARRSEELESTAQRYEAARSAQSELEQTVKSLAREVQVWREGYEGKLETIARLEGEVEALRKRFEDSHNNSSLAVVLIDGDGSIIAPEFLADGQQGGRRAAQILNSRVLEYIGRSGIRVMASVYCNKLGLRTTLGLAKVCTAQQFDDFWDGFQATGLFCLIDVGVTKEGADAKIRDAVDLFGRMPQVARVFLGGAHDGGYHSPLSALELDGFIDKIVLLRAYDEELPKDLRKLALKEVKFEGLFMEKKIQVNHSHKDVGTASLPRPTSQHGKEREKEKDSDGSSSVGGAAVLACQWFYLQPTGCQFGAQCKFSHTRKLSEKEIAQLRAQCKSQPCNAVNKNQICTLGNNCIFSHKCRSGPSCSQARLGTCKWVGRGMHERENTTKASSTTSSATPDPVSLDNSFLIFLMDANSIQFTQSRMNDGRTGGKWCAATLEICARSSQGIGPTSPGVTFTATVIADLANLRITLPKLGTCSVPQLEAFVEGFGAHRDTFSIQDVKGVTDGQTKVRELLSIYVRMDQVKCVFLCIDGTAAPSYLEFLAGLKNDGLADKVVLVRVQEQLHADLAPLGFRELFIDGVFRKPKSIQTPSTPGPFSPSLPTTPLAKPATLGSTDDKAPCNFHYILGPGGCTLSSECSYSHKKHLSHTEIAKLRHGAKTSPCLFLKKGKQCPHGAQCCMAHKCPNGRACDGLKPGLNCKFPKTMHT